MEIITKHYVEMYLPVNPDRGVSFEPLVRPISERKPLEIGCSHITTHFRYFDITEVTLDDGETLYGKRKNYSPMYYYGTRLNKDDIKQLGVFWENFCQEKGINSLIQCYDGTIITNPSEGNLTIEEVKAQTQDKKSKTK